MQSIVNETVTAADSREETANGCRSMEKYSSAEAESPSNGWKDCDIEDGFVENVVDFSLAVVEGEFGIEVVGRGGHLIYL